MDAMDVYESALGLVGGNPLVRLRTGGAAAVYAKLEYLSIGGSAKDRIGPRMIKQAEKEGLMRPGGTVVEAHTGYTGQRQGPDRPAHDRAGGEGRTAAARRNRRRGHLRQHGHRARAGGGREGVPDHGGRLRPGQ